jgi:hypothetical protein
MLRIPALDVVLRLWSLLDFCIHLVAYTTAIKPRLLTPVLLMVPTWPFSLLLRLMAGVVATQIAMHQRHRP